MSSQRLLSDCYVNDIHINCIYDDFCVHRFDGGDGGLLPPRDHYHYLRYHRSVSADYGRTWSPLTPIMNAGCARPRLLLMNNILLLSGGRFRVDGNTSDVLLWVATDGVGEDWVSFSLSYYHNLGADISVGVVPFDWKVNASNTTGLGPRETNAYTSIVQLNSSTVAVFYDQKNGSVTHAYRTKVISYSMLVHLS